MSRVGQAVGRRRSVAGDRSRRAAVASARGLLAAALACGACADQAEPPPAGSPIGEALAAVRAHEDARRAATDFTRVPGRHRALGPDPAALAVAPGGLVVGTLRGEDAVVLLGPDLAILDRAPGPALLSDVAPLDDLVLAAGEGSSLVARWRVDGGRLVALPPVALASGTQVRALAADGDVAFALDATADVLVALDASGELRRVPTAASPLRVVATPAHVVVGSLVGRRVEVFERDEEGLPEGAAAAAIARQAPAWALDAVEHRGDLWIAVASAEDAPLDRTVGSFGYVDSVVEVHRVRGEDAERVAVFLAGEAGLVVPKAIALEVDGEAVRLAVIAAGSPRAAAVTWARAGDALAPPRVALREVPPGTSDAVLVGGEVVAAASPLLDAWWSDTSPATPAPAAHPDARTPSSRLGEALLTTTLLAPDQSSEGPLSRFTCETCHLDLGIDGRTHATGRDDGSVATTKPLFGLFNNGPHFTRALDRDLTEVAHNEVRVANLHTGVHPWSAIDPARTPWLADVIGDEPDPALLRPAGVRQALVDALADLAHRPNPRVIGRGVFTSEEARGAEVFRDRCAGCHAARLVARDPATEVPFEAWEALVFSEAGPLVWARDGYHRTGIEPYVHEGGARTTSLRRVVDKRPYFTDGSSTSLADVLERARMAPGGVFLHGSDGRDLPGLTADERRALGAFLVLL